MAIRILSGFLACATVVGAAASAQTTFRASTHVVALYPSVRDDRGGLIADLTRDDFAITEDGRPASVSLFANERQPVTAVVLVDTSASIDVGTLERVRAGLLTLVGTLEPEDRLRFGTFGVEIGLSPFLTNDRNILSRVLHEELWPGGHTPLWRAVDAAISSISTEPGRHVVIVMTDGLDYSPSGYAMAPLPGGLARLRTRAIEDSDLMLYAVGLKDDRGLGGVSGGIVELADLTGGGYVNVPATADLGAAFKDIAEQLRHQYVLGLRPSVLDDKVHTLRVRVSRPHATVHARTTYIAKRNSPK